MRKHSVTQCGPKQNKIVRQPALLQVPLYDREGMTASARISPCRQLARLGARFSLTYEIGIACRVSGEYLEDYTAHVHGISPLAVAQLSYEPRHRRLRRDRQASSTPSLDVTVTSNFRRAET